MTPIQTAIFTTLGQFAGLNALVGARIFPDVAAQDAIPPRVVWQEISEVQPADLGGTSETASLKNCRVQITSWAKDSGRGASIARDVDYQVRLAMQQASLFKSILVDARALPYEPDTKLHGMQSDFSVWLKT